MVVLPPKRMNWHVEEQGQPGFLLTSLGGICIKNILQEIIKNPIHP